MCLSVRESQNELIKLSAHACCAKLPRTRYRKVDGAFFFFFFLKNDGKCNFPGIDPLGNLQRAMWGMSGGAGTGWGVQ